MADSLSVTISIVVNLILLAVLLLAMVAAKTPPEPEKEESPNTSHLDDRASSTESVRSNVDDERFAPTKVVSSVKKRLSSQSQTIERSELSHTASLRLSQAYDRSDPPPAPSNMRKSSLVSPKGSASCVLQAEVLQEHEDYQSRSGMSPGFHTINIEYGRITRRRHVI